MTFEQINHNLYQTLLIHYPDDCSRVLDQSMCDIDGSFLGFVNIYYHLAQVIPKHFSVLDLGCAYAAQAYYFQDHTKYIGVDVAPLERFSFENTEHKEIRIQEEIENWKGKDTSTVFAICSYVPIDTKPLREVFQNLFVYYPHS